MKHGIQDKWWKLLVVLGSVTILMQFGEIVINGIIKIIECFNKGG